MKRYIILFIVVFVRILCEKLHWSFFWCLLYFKDILMLYWNEGTSYLFWKYPEDIDIDGWIDTQKGNYKLEYKWQEIYTLINLYFSNMIIKYMLCYSII